MPITKREARRKLLTALPPTTQNVPLHCGQSGEWAPAALMKKIKRYLGIQKNEIIIPFDTESHYFDDKLQNPIICFWLGDGNARETLQRGTVVNKTHF